MGLFGKFKENNSIQAEVIGDNYQAFSTPFQKVPKSNLSLPFVWGRYEVRGYVPFGDDNMYPQWLNQMYYSSPLHGSIVDFKANAAVGGGFEFNTDRLNAKGKTDLYAFSKQLNFHKLIPLITKEIIVHERNYFLVDVKDGKVTKAKRISADKVRVNKNRSEYSVCEDWLSTTDIKKYLPYNKGCKNGTYILTFENLTLGQDIYPIPSYTSALNFAYLSGELSYLAKNNIQNSIFPSFAMLFPKKPQSEEEMEAVKDSVKNMKGAENAGKPVAFFANSKDQLPELVTVPTNANDSLFKETSELITEQVCFAHTIDPILLGVRTTGSLGNGSDIKQAYTIFEKNVVMPLRERIENIINTLLEVMGIEATITVNNFQIINETIVEIEEEGSATMDALNSMSPLVATKVLESMSENEIRSLAGLPPVKGGELSNRQREQVAQGIDPNETIDNAGAETLSNESMVNDALKGLTAKDNMDMMRIVRDFNKGKLPEALARTRLAAYGIDADTINEILSV